MARDFIYFIDCKVWLFDYILYIVVFSLPLRKIAANYCRLKSIKYTELLLS